MKIKLIACLIAISGITNAQLTFQKAVGATSTDESRSVVKTADGGYAIAGSTTMPGAGGYDMYVIKTDINGTIVWTKTYGGAGDDLAKSVQQTLDGGYIIAGSTNSFGANSADIYLVKTDLNGTALWSKTYGGAPQPDEGYSVKQTTDGGYIISGGTNSFGAGYTDAYLVKTNSSGTIQWTKAFGESNSSEWGYSVIQTNDGGYLMAGNAYSLSAGNTNVYFVKTDGTGTAQWTRQYGGSLEDYGRSVQQTTDGGFVVAGSSNSFAPGGLDVYLLKTNSAGDTLFAKTFGGVGNDDGYSVQQTADGGYVIAGGTTSFGVGASDVYLIKTNASGTLQWSKLFGGPGYDIGYGVVKTTEGGYLVGGDTQSFGVGNSDIYMIKTDSNGDSGCNENIPATLTKSPLTTIAIPPTQSAPGGILLSVTSQTTTGGTLTTLCTTTGIDNPPAPMNASIEIYPNPFSSTTTLQVSDPFTNATLTIYNSFGQQARQMQNISGANITLQRDHLPTGLYFIRLTEDHKVIAADKLVITDN